MANLKQLDLFFDNDSEQEVLPATTENDNEFIVAETQASTKAPEPIKEAATVSAEEKAQVEKPRLKPPIDNLYEVPESITTNITAPAVSAQPTFAPIPDSSRNGKKRGRKSIKELEATADLIEVPNDEELFSKLYYSMGEVTNMFKVNHSLLRYWETEFTILKPRKNRKGDRHFRPEDIKNLVTIHHLLRVKKLTIQGAKEHLKNQKKVEEKFALIQQLQKLKSFLQEIKTNIDTQQ